MLPRPSSTNVEKKNRNQDSGWPRSNSQVLLNVKARSQSPRLYRPAIIITKQGNVLIICNKPSKKRKKGREYIFGLKYRRLYYHETEYING